MKLVTVLSLTVMLVLMACGGGALPEDSMTAFVEAIKAGDGETAASYISSHALSEMDVQLVAIKENPEMSVTYFATMGVEATADEIADWTSQDLLAAFFGSPGMVEELGDKLDMEVTGSEIEGSEAVVFITTADGDEKEIDMVLEDGVWKLYEMPSD
ncbi:MAG: hypothetical protein KAR44_05405 [Candidatus Aegiribacteria sp.]|nr:hypothetical protein [Candidatus Aegiribacteria sp.]